MILHCSYEEMTAVRAGTRVALAEVESELGLVTPEQVADLRAHAGDVDVERALEIAEKLCNKLEKSPLLVDGKPLAMTASFGDILNDLGALNTNQVFQLILKPLITLRGHWYSL